MTIAPTNGPTEGRRSNFVTKLIVSNRFFSGSFSRLGESAPSGPDAVIDMCSLLVSNNQKSLNKSSHLGELGHRTARKEQSGVPMGEISVLASVDGCRNLADVCLRDNQRSSGDACPATNGGTVILVVQVQEMNRQNALKKLLLVHSKRH